MIRGKYLTSMDDISKILEIRNAVFSEIHPAWAGRDQSDDMAVYALAFSNDVPAACCRLAIENDKFVLGRVCVLKEHRNEGLGDLTVRMALVRAIDLGAGEIFVRPLPGNEKFYSNYGFEESEPGVMRATPESIDKAGGCSGKCCAK